MLHKTLSGLSIFLLSSLSYASLSMPSYTSTEHIMLGNKIEIFFSAEDPGKTAYIFQLSNGLKISYGELIAFGDLYGVEPISHGTSPAERKQRFISAFQSFANDPNALQEAHNILAIMHDEEKMINDALAKGEDVRDVYKKIGSDISRRLNCATGGGCDEDTWWMNQGRYLTLAEKNFDHFGNDAWIAYETGHQAAIDVAISAHLTHDQHRLALAYAMNAFACHFLSDRFSAGHIRTPRYELAEHTTPNVTGNLLAGFMHNEENAAGVHVHNQRGDQWVSYGDRQYLSTENSQNRFLLNTTLQDSARQIFIAYQSGIAPQDDTKNILPIANESANQANLDISPLFYWDADKKVLMRREDLSNPYDRHWTDNWWAWSTLAELTKERGIPAYVKQQIAKCAAENSQSA